MSKASCVVIKKVTLKGTQNQIKDKYCSTVFILFEKPARRTKVSKTTQQTDSYGGENT